MKQIFQAFLLLVAMILAAPWVLLGMQIYSHWVWGR